MTYKPTTMQESIARSADIRQAVVEHLALYALTPDGQLARADGKRLRLDHTHSVQVPMGRLKTPVVLAYLKTQDIDYLTGIRHDY